MKLSTKKSIIFIAINCMLAVSLPAIAGGETDWQKVLAEGNHELSMGNSEKAADIFAKKVSKYPNSAVCHVAMGKAYKRLGRIDDAKSEFRKATEVEPSCPDGFYELGVMQESDRNWASAVTCFEKYLELKPDASERQALGDRIQYCLSQSPTPISSYHPPSTRPLAQPIAANVPALPVAVAEENNKAVDSQASMKSAMVVKTNATSAQALLKQKNESTVNKPIRDKWALIVGIGNFANSSIPHLKYATKDARDLYSYLVHEGNFAPDHIRLLLDEKATQRRIMSELGSKFLARLAKPDDLIFLFFSTHGSPSQMDIRGKNYIVAYDSEPEDLFASGIEMQKILEAIQGRVLSDRVLLVLDACHSGGVNPDAKGMMRVGNFDAEALAEGSGQMVICSSQPDQQSWESKRYQNGVFTKNLLEGLHKAGAKGPISQAFSTTEQLVQDEVQEDHPGARQTPMLHSKWTGNELIVAIKPSAPQKVPPTVACELEPDSSEVTLHTQIASAKTLTPNLSEQAKSPLKLTASYFSNEPNPKAAYESMCQATDVNFNNPEFYFRKAKILIQLGNWAKAMTELKGVIVDDPNKYEYYLARALCYHKLSMEALAQADIRTAKFKNPLLPESIEFGD